MTPTVEAGQMESDQHQELPQHQYIPHLATIKVNLLSPYCALYDFQVGDS